MKFLKFYFPIIVFLQILNISTCLRKEKITLKSGLNSKSASNTKNKEKMQSQFQFKKFNFEFEKYKLNSQMFSQFYTRKKSSSEISSNNGTSIQNSFYNDLNTTFTVMDSNMFRKSHRNWDFKILDKQLEEIFATMLYNQQDRMTTNGMRNYMQMFINNYQNCDKNKDNVLNKAEFTNCMKNDPYLKLITPTPKKYAANINYATSSVFYTILFNILDERYEGYVNFVGYMRTRLMAFSWKECSVMAPYLEEVDFECALEIAAGFKTATRTMARNIFKLALELSNNPSLRNLDFISYFLVVNTVRLYGKINSKEDNDISRSEFNLALDDNLLPILYNQEIIDQIFKLVEDYDRPNQGIDLQSFIYYDFLLQLFSFEKQKRYYHLSLKELETVLEDEFFPKKILTEIFLIPQYNLTKNSYNMYQYLNVSQYITQEDFLYSFLEVKNENQNENQNLNKHIPVDHLDFNQTTNKYNISFSINNTRKLLFNVIDTDQDGWINFYEFSSFMQMALVFSRADTYNKGKVPAGVIYENLKNYADFPIVSYRLRERAERFNSFDQNLYMDLLSAMQTVWIQDIVKYYTRKTDRANVNEVEMKKILTQVNMRHVPDPNLHRCLRGVDSMTIPRYDWECCFIQGMNLNLKYFEAMNNYQEVKINKLAMLNTVFNNIDPTYA